MVVRGAPVTFERPALVELAVRDVALRLETGTDVDYIAMTCLDSSDQGLLENRLCSAGWG